MEVTEEQLAEEIKRAKEKYQELYWKVYSICFFCCPERFVIELQNKITKNKKSHTFYRSYFKELKGKTDKEISKVSILGEKAIQWEELDIQIGLEKLLMSTQLLEEWKDSLE